MTRGAAAGLALAAALTTPARSADDPALYPAAQCAALWFGQDDYARRSAMLDPSPGGVELAEAFRKVALRLTTRSPAAIDAFIARQRPIMAFMIEAYIYGGDTQSRELYRSLMQDCASFAATQPETRLRR